MVGDFPPKNQRKKYKFDSGRKSDDGNLFWIV